MSSHSRPTAVHIPTAAELLGIGLTLAYDLANVGALTTGVPVIRIGGRLIVPVAAIERVLGPLADEQLRDGGHRHEDNRSSRRRPTAVSVRTAASLFGIGRTVAYALANAGALTTGVPVIRIGGRLIVPVAAIERVLGPLTDEQLRSAARPDTDDCTTMRPVSVSLAAAANLFAVTIRCAVTAAASGHLAPGVPAIRIGGRLIVPVSAIERVLGPLTDDQLHTAARTDGE